MTYECPDKHSRSVDMEHESDVDVSKGPLNGVAQGEGGERLYRF